MDPLLRFQFPNPQRHLLDFVYPSRQRSDTTVQYYIEFSPILQHLLLRLLCPSVFFTFRVRYAPGHVIRFFDILNYPSLGILSRLLSCLFVLILSDIYRCYWTELFLAREETVKVALYSGILS